MRRATDTTLENHLNRIISIHALHEENDPLYGANALLPAISIHALHEENDGDAVEDRADLRISIHALHEESDRTVWARRTGTQYFNPRSP